MNRDPAKPCKLQYALSVLFLVSIEAIEIFVERQIEDDRESVKTKNTLSG